MTAQLEQVLSRLGVFDVAANRIVCATHPALDLEFDVRFETSLWTSDDCVVSKLILHLAEEDTSSVHVWLCDEAVQEINTTPRARCAVRLTIFHSPGS